MIDISDYTGCTVPGSIPNTEFGFVLSIIIICDFPVNYLISLSMVFIASYNFYFSACSVPRNSTG